MKIDPSQLESSGFVDPKLTRILHFIEAQTGLEFLTTSMYRPSGEGVHSVLPLRGWDLRCWDAVIGERVCDVVNQAFVYDPSRESMKCAIYHDTGEGAHIHIQVHPNTVRVI